MLKKKTSSLFKHVSYISYYLVQNKFKLHEFDLPTGISPKEFNSASSELLFNEDITLLHEKFPNRDDFTPCSACSEYNWDSTESCVSSQSENEGMEDENDWYIYDSRNNDPDDTGSGSDMDENYDFQRHDFFNQYESFSADYVDYY
ncbi:HHL043Wp [Eremothecium sinecaudum]|uniref:HHL043Wp n=1 Tax=Eremothecium sinecaudum TaxID=45286 RepID=A0A109UYJ6_9SACH|nr:HHL043Wp [Eremothecium sinecaudum]AMD22727.1 HHL043Wp [Eremothecium sinecaudum]